MNNKPKTKVFFKNLDAWRFIAFFAVFLFHGLNTSQSIILNDSKFIFFKNIFSFGHLGVNLFFVLSGFLITYLLLTEERNSILKNYSIPKFWGRRVLRIWPLYCMILFYAFVLYEPLIKFITNKNSIEHANLFFYLFFIPNFQLVMNQVYPLNNCLTVLWSVGIEEQFYLFWPLLFYVKRARIYIIGLIIISSIFFRYFNAGDFHTIHYHSFSVMGVLGIGCLLAYITFNYKLRQNSIKINKLLNLAIYILSLVVIYIYPVYLFSAIGEALFTTFTGIFFAYLIFEQIFVVNPIFNLGKVKFFNTWGKYTYGLYCLHPIGLLIAFNITKIIKFESSLLWVIIGEMIIGLLLSMILAWASFHLVEKHFLKLKLKISTITK